MQQQTLEQYQAVRDAVGFLDLSDRGKIEVAGPDRITFLHSMISNDVKELPELAGRYGTFLTARGRIVSDFFTINFLNRSSWISPPTCWPRPSRRWKSTS